MMRVTCSIVLISVFLWSQFEVTKADHGESEVDAEFGDEDFFKTEKEIFSGESPEIFDSEPAGPDISVQDLLGPGLPKLPLTRLGPRKLGPGLARPGEVAPVAKATAIMRSYGKTVGRVNLIQVGSGPTRIVGAIGGLKPGSQHGFHFHEHPAETDCKAAGEHYNPFGSRHGGRNSPQRHIGDLGNLRANSKGIAAVNIVDRQVSLRGPVGMVGRTLVVHFKPDDLGAGLDRESAETGNSGGRLSCGTVKPVNSFA